MKRKRNQMIEHRRKGTPVSGAVGMSPSLGMLAAVAGSVGQGAVKLQNRAISRKMKFENEAVKVAMIQTRKAHQELNRRRAQRRLSKQGIRPR